MKPHNILITVLLTITLAACNTPTVTKTSSNPAVEVTTTSSPVATSVPGVVTFADPVLEAMIRGAMGKPEGEITLAEAQGVTRMDLTDSLQRQLSDTILLIRKNSKSDQTIESEIPENLPSLRRAIIGFSIAALVLVIATPILVDASAKIAEITGLGTSFIGTTLVAVVTSLPELVICIAAIRIGAHDMAIGNLFGSNMFNMFILGATDIFYTKGRFLASIDSSFILVGILGLLMTTFGLISNLIRFERRVGILEIDALVLILMYFGGLWLLYAQSAVP